MGQFAKALNLGLIYGIGAEQLRAHALADYGLRLSLAEAARLRTEFFRAYPDLARWHGSARACRDGETRTLAGRRRYLSGAHRFTQRLNTPIQGTGADGLKRALAPRPGR
jgi:DNA polymerase-1